VLSLVFGVVGVAMLLVYRFMFFCRPGTQKQLTISYHKTKLKFDKKNHLRTSDEFGWWKIVRFCQHLNLNSVTPLRKMLVISAEAQIIQNPNSKHSHTHTHTLESFIIGRQLSTYLNTQKTVK